MEKVASAYTHTMNKTAGEKLLYNIEFNLVLCDNLEG